MFYKVVNLSRDYKKTLLLAERKQKIGNFLRAFPRQNAKDLHKKKAAEKNTWYFSQKKKNSHSLLAHKTFYSMTKRACYFTLLFAQKLSFVDEGHCASQEERCSEGQDRTNSKAHGTRAFSVFTGIFAHKVKVDFNSFWRRSWKCHNLLAT